MSSFDDYVDPLAPPSKEPTTSVSGFDYADIGKGAVGGLGRGTAGLIGTPGTVGGYVHSGLSKLGIPEDFISGSAKALGMAMPAARMFQGPDAGAAQQGIEKYTGEFYQPKTIPGQYASTIGEFAPAALIPGGGGVASRIVNTVVPAIASETAGQLTKGSPAEPYVRGAAALASGLGVGKIITPTAAPTRAHQAAVRTLEAEGVPLTAAERTGSQQLRWLEAAAGDNPLASRTVQAQKEAQAAALDTAITNRVFDRNQLAQRGIAADEALPHANVMNTGRHSLSDEYTRLSAANQLRSDPQLFGDLATTQRNYERLAMPESRAGGARNIGALHGDIIDSLIQSAGRMPGDVYQATRSRFGTLARGANNDPYLQNALRDTRTALDEAMQRSLSPRDAAAWTLNNQRWANMKQLEGAVARSDAHLSPASFAQGVRSGRTSEAARGIGNMDELARAAKAVVKPMPQSGTAPRLNWSQLFHMFGPSSAGAAGGGLVGGPIGAVVGALAPHAVMRAAVSRPGQAYLSNQILPQNARDILAQTAAQQAIANPTIESQTTSYEQKRKEMRRKAGLY